ncbi:MAG: TolB family protein [Candidatus Anammoxibacter sp.]
MKNIAIFIAVITFLCGCKSVEQSTTKDTAPLPSTKAVTKQQLPPENENINNKTNWFPGEKHLANIKQLSFGGENAEAYFSYDGSKLIFQSTRDNYECDQIFTMNSDGTNVLLVSTGKGRTTCSFILPNEDKIIYSSTHLGGTECPPSPSHEHGYVWPLYHSFDIFSANIDGSNLTRMTFTDGYDAEAVISPDGKKIVFTSVRDGDLEIYTMNTDGTDVKRLTNAIGYDGGPFFSFDCKKIVYRAHHPKDSKEIERYQMLLEQGLIEPKALEIFVMDVDGSNQIQITDNGAANFGPYFHPNGKQIIFASNTGDPKGRNFDLYLINVDGTNIEQITFNDTFDGFPMFSHDGKKLVFASNRNAKVKGETNIFIADWID